MTALAPTLQSFFDSYLIGQRGASPNTVAAYRDTFRLLLGFAHQRTGIAPSDLDTATLDAGLVGEFLAMLEHQRHNSSSTRNARLAGIHSLFTHAALRHPEHADTIARVLAIPYKNCDQTVVCYLSDDEADALVAAPDTDTWTGRRDHLLIVFMITTGMRVAEVTSVRRCDISTERPGAHVACTGKGRKTRITPLETATITAINDWLTRNPAPPDAPLFTPRGRGHRPLSADAVAQRIATHTATAAATCPTLATKNVTPHVLRHTCAMRMLAAGVGAATIALWFGHESLASTPPEHADLELKQKALDRTAPPRTAKGRYRPTDKLLAYLEAL